MNPSSIWPGNDRESFNSVTLFGPGLRQEEEIWIPRRPHGVTESIELQNRTSASNDDLTSLDSWTQSVMLSKSSVGSSNSLESTAFSTSSVNTTPAESPISTPTIKRKKLKPALKLNLDEVTWTHSGDRRHHRSRRLRQNLQAGSARVRAVMKQSKTPQFRFRMILLTLFALIVTIVSFTWHMYQRQLLQLTIGNKIRFHEARRVLHLLTDEGSELVEAVLGDSLPSDLTPYHCDIQSPLSTPHMCEEWKYRARLHINFSHTSNLSCYYVHWEGLQRNTVLRDCVDLKGAKWYGMGLSRRLQWPLQATLGDEAHPFVTGDGVEQIFGGVLERYWLSSDGVAVVVDLDVALYVSMTGRSLCLESKRDEDFPYHISSGNNVLSYTICTGENMKTLHKEMMQSHRKPAKNLNENVLMNSQMWTVALGDNLNQSSIQDFANRIMEHKAWLPGFLLLDSRWQQQEGSLDFNSKEFPEPSNILKILHHKGFGIMLEVHPYICQPSKAFESACEAGHFVTDVWKHVPLLNRWRGKICGLLDLTNNFTAMWFHKRLTRLKQKYDIQGFVFTGGQTTYLPKSYSYYNSTLNPDLFLSHYLAVAEKMGSQLGTEVGFLTQNFPGFVRITPRTVSWDTSSGLASVIPEVLTLSLLGYSLVNPGSVGGDGDGEIPSKELYLRWFELAVFLPIVQLTVPPGYYDKEVVETVYNLYVIRQSLVLPAFRAITEGPLIRPLWWISPDDFHAQASNSQFMVGEKLMIAPVLEEKRRNRDIYLPAGWWLDHLLGETRRGGKWLHNYPIPLTKVAYFTLTNEPFE